MTTTKFKIMTDLIIEGETEKYPLNLFKEISETIQSILKKHDFKCHNGNISLIDYENSGFSACFIN